MMKQSLSLTYLICQFKCCGLRRDLQWGRRLHARAVGKQGESRKYLVTALVSMYAKCGSMLDSRRVFDGIFKPDVVSWTVLLQGYAENGEAHAALDLFTQMKAHGCLPTSVTYVVALKACTSLAIDGDCSVCLDRGRAIHFEIGCHSHDYVQNTLINMYAKCGSMVEARGVFDSIQNPSVVCWTALLLGYAENGAGRTALDLFSRMKEEGCQPNCVTYIAVLKSCISLLHSGGTGKEECLRIGRGIHSEVGCHMDRYVQNTLIDMYAKCGSMIEACRMFDSVKGPNVVSWNNLILGYVENGNGHAALGLFSRMKARACPPDCITYVAVLKACASLAVTQDGKRDCLERGRTIHSEISSNLNHYVQNTLIVMYSKGGSMDEARKVFDGIPQLNVVSWNALLLGYAENGNGYVALDLFSIMKARGCAPDAVTYIAVLKACASLAANGDSLECLKRGREIHSEITCELNLYLQNALIDMYTKCGSMVDAHRVFDSVQNPDVVSWTPLLLGYAENGDGHAVLALFSRMKASGCAPDSVAYIAALKACGLLGDLVLGRGLHLDIREFTAHVVTSLLGFYAKCGSMTEARRVFDSHPIVREVSTWNALLAGYASSGETQSAFDAFEAMRCGGFRPDSVTFVCVLLCCNHAGLVEKAKEYFEAMPRQYGVAPLVMHYNCMVDVLGRANQLHESLGMIRRMPCSPHATTWNALLGACFKWKNAEIGRLAYESLVAMNFKDSSVHVLMAHIFGSKGMWEEQQRVLETDMKDGTLKRAVEAQLSPNVAVDEARLSPNVGVDEASCFLIHHEQT